MKQLATWTLQRKQFKFNSLSVEFEARTDGHFQVHGTERSAAILEVNLVYGYSSVDAVLRCKRVHRWCCGYSRSQTVTGLQAKKVLASCKSWLLVDAKHPSNLLH